MVDTGSNGKGPLVPKRRVGHGNEVLCNPPGRGLGPLTLSGDVAQQSGYAATDGLLWFSTTRGLLVLDSRNAERRFDPPPAIVEDVNRFNVSY